MLIVMTIIIPNINLESPHYLATKKEIGYTSSYKFLYSISTSNRSLVVLCLKHDLCCNRSVACGKGIGPSERNLFSLFSVLLYRNVTSRAGVCILLRPETLLCDAALCKFLRLLLLPFVASPYPCNGSLPHSHLPSPPAAFL